MRHRLAWKVLAALLEIWILSKLEEAARFVAGVQSQVTRPLLLGLHIVLLTLRYLVVLRNVIEFLKAEVLVRLTLQFLELNRLLQYFVLRQLFLISLLDLRVLFLQLERPPVQFLLFCLQVGGSLVHLVLFVLDLGVLIAHFAFVDS